jgi:hypothetical protein
MKKIILLSCVSKKRSRECKARELYISPLFRKSLSYAQLLQPDAIYILSAEHGLLELDAIVRPYDKTLNDMRIERRREWAANVITQLDSVSDLQRDHFIILAGRRYVEFLIPHLGHTENPLARLGITVFLGVRVMSICREFHAIVSLEPRLNFPFDRSHIPKNGVYVLFERGEYGHAGDRIVRVGSHTGNRQLPPRLQQHFLKENKDRSIFRKNIGRALLCREEDSFITQWELDLTSRASREKYLSIVDSLKLKMTEDAVSDYIRQNLVLSSFR